MTTFMIGYDPGGNLAHGVAVLGVREENNCWEGVSLEASAKRTLGDAVAWLEERCRDGQIVACGVDTLTEWNGGKAGWRTEITVVSPRRATEVIPDNLVNRAETPARPRPYGLEDREHGSAG